MADKDSIWTTLGKILLSFLSNKAEGKVGAEISIPIAVEEPVENKPATSVETEEIKFALTHNRFCSDGIFGVLNTAEGQLVAYTLEHSYDNKPKLSDGIYTCIRGPHRLHGMTEDFITFEIKGVPDFEGKSVTGVLFHWGNYNKDSEGCVLLGSEATPTMITHSRQTWADFMKYLDGIDSFKLKVISA
jgi:hypothetical protein